jgi:hypothetical protein
MPWPANAATTIHALDLNPTAAAAANSDITTNSKRTVRTEPLITANNTQYKATTITTVG